MRRAQFQVPCLVALLVAVSAATAQAASPSLSNILPRGGQRGTDVEVQCQGGNLNDAVDLLFHDPGIALKEIVEAKSNNVRCVLRIAADCRLGRHAIRVRTASGISNLAIFSVGALTELAEAEPNSSPEEAQAVELGTTVNGVVRNEDVDYFAVDLEKDARLAVEVEAIRLGHALFDPKLRLFGPGGYELRSEDDTALMRQDAAFVYTAKDAGKYLVAVSEASYGGADNFEYRLHIGRFPRPLAVEPMGGKPGETIRVKWLGDPGLTESDIVLASDVSGTAEVSATSDLGSAPTPLPFRAVDLPSVVEAEPNNAPDQATAGQAPGAFNGVISEDGDVDWFSFDGTKDQNVDIRLWGRSMGSPLDSVLVLRGPDGNQLASNDDNGGLDSGAQLALPADGKYTLEVRDHLGHGGPTYAYRVEVTPIGPSMSLSAAENDAAAVAVPRGNRALLLLALSRSRFNSPVNVAFGNVPAGVTAEHGAFAPGESRLPVILSAAGDASPGGQLVAVEGKAADNDAITGGFDQTIRLVLGANQTLFDAYQATRLAVAVTEEAPFSIEITPPKAALVLNSMVELHVVAHRNEGFTAPIRLRAPWMPRGCALPQGTIGEGQTETTIRLEVHGDAPKGEVHLVVVGDSGGYQVCTPFSPVTIEDPWVAMDLQPIQAEQGQDVSWPAKVTVSKPFEGTFMFEMQRLPKGVTTEPQPIKADTTEITFPVKVAADAPEGKHNVAVRTTLAVNGEEILQGLGGAELKIFKPLPPQLQQPKPKPEAQPKKEEPAKRRTRFPNAG